MITLYGMSSPNVLKVTILLEELGLGYQFEHVNVFSGDQRSDTFLAMNPNGRVPVLVDSKTGITSFESGAILLYLAETYGRFLPTAGPLRYDVTKWLMWQMASMGPLLGQLNHFGNNADIAASNPYALKRYRREAKRIYGVINTQLATSTWLAGDDYSVADIATYPWIDYLEPHGFSLTDFPALEQWQAKISKRDAVVRARAQMADVRKADEQFYAAASPEDIKRFFGRD